MAATIFFLPFSSRTAVVVGLVEAEAAEAGGGSGSPAVGSGSYAPWEWWRWRRRQCVVDDKGGKKIA